MLRWGVVAVAHPATAAYVGRAVGHHEHRWSAGAHCPEGVDAHLHRGCSPASRWRPGARRQGRWRLCVPCIVVGLGRHGAAAIEAPNGSYVVAWRVVSADGHPVHGAFHVSVGEESALGADLAIGRQRARLQVRNRSRQWRGSSRTSLPLASPGSCSWARRFAGLAIRRRSRAGLRRRPHRWGSWRSCSTSCFKARATPGVGRER